MKKHLALLSVTAILPSLAACGSTSSTTSPDRIVVSAALYPIVEIVQRIGGDAVDVVNLTPPGSDAHDVELTAKQVQKLEESDVVFYFGDNFQPGAEKAITALSDVTIVDLFESVDLLDATIDGSAADDHGHEGEKDDEEHDPHVWLDPENMIAMTKMVASTLKTVRPEMADTITANSTAYIAELTELGQFLDTQIGIADGEGASRCAELNLYTAHQGFTYLAHRAGLVLIPIAGINPDEQVSAQYLESLATALKGKDVTIFYESLIPSATAKVLADSLKISTEFLNPVEGLSDEDISDGVTYLSAQRDNIQKIAEALRCS